jgi:hypothetical protein
MPVHKIPKRSGRVSGRYPSMKLQRMVSFEAMIEQDFICLLDFAPTVTTFEEQPLTIVYEQDGKTRRYTPDFYVLEGECRYLVECKSAFYVNDEDNQPKYAAARRWCAVNGFEFLIVTDKTIQASGLMPNVAVLTRYGRFHIEEQLIKKMPAVLFGYQQPAYLSELSQLLPHWPSQIIRAAALYLVYHQAIYLLQPLTTLALTKDDLLFTSIPGEKLIILPGVQHNGCS